MLKEEVTGIRYLLFIRNRGRYCSQLHNGKPVFLHKDNEIKPEGSMFYWCVISEKKEYCLAQLIRPVSMYERVYRDTYMRLLKESKKWYEKELPPLKELEKQEMRKKEYSSPSRTSRIQKAAQLLDEKEKTSKRKVIK